MDADQVFAGEGKTTAQWKAAFEIWLARGPSSPTDGIRAFELLGKAAENGDPDAAFYYATVIHEGLGVPACPQEALTWYIQAAKGGHLEAAFRVAQYYETGAGSFSSLAKTFYGQDSIPEDAKLAQLVDMLSEMVSKHTDPHLELAAYWYKRAADMGHIWAQSSYARLLEAGVTPCIDRFGKMPD